MKFEELEIAEPILRAIREKGYDVPTPIQEKGIPIALSGRDVLGIAQTGTGKTAAFAIPIIQYIWNTEKEKRQLKAEPIESGKRLLIRKERRGRSHGKELQRHEIKALILTPTRELAIQIDDCFADYSKHTGLKHTVIFGGVKQNPQVEKLQQGVDVLTATPGRLLDLIGQGFIRLSDIEYFVLDEADRMLDMGFIADIKRLLPLLPDKRQTMFFSATMPTPIVKLSQSILTHPVRVEVTPVSSAVEVIDQGIYFVEKPQKKELLIEVLRQEGEVSVLVFSRTKHGADKISRILTKAGIHSEAIHGDKSQGQRQRALSNFKSGKTKVMIATDIAARGIDINQLEMVINYDLPDTAETYVHRIGRTGRAGHSGRALTFCSQEELPMVNDIQKLTGRKLDPLPISN